MLLSDRDERMAEVHRQLLLDEAEAARLLQQVRARQPVVWDWLLLELGDLLVALGSRLKQRAVPQASLR